MDPLILLLWVAGGVQIVIAASNIFLPGKLNYRENLSHVSPIVRQVFIVHSVYIVLVIVMFSGLCFHFPYELLGGHPLGLTITVGMAIFWLVRVPIQLFYYDAKIKQENPILNVLFTGALIFLAVAFSIAAFGRLL